MVESRKQKAERFCFTLEGNAWAIFPALGGILILSTVFITDPSLVNGLVMGKVFGFHKVIFIFAIITLLSIIIHGIEERSKPICRQAQNGTDHLLKNTNFINIILPDIFIVLFLAITLLTYNWQLHPEPDKLLFGGQLILLWFMLRVILKMYPSLKLFFLAFILLIGLIEAYWGLEQLYGYRGSTHYLFRLTGSFYNPGPYSGYLAIILPVALSFILRIGKQKKQAWWHYTTILYYLSWVCLVIILLVLPAGMSRSAWLAAIISCCWVYWTQRFGWKKTKSFWRKHKKWALSLSGLFILCLVLGSIAIYLLKKDSADGRLLMWKITGHAIMEQSITGTGLGGFPAAYAQEQANYFESGKASQTEKLIAGCPEYAFNEFLQIGLEQGIPGLVCFLLWLGYCFYHGIKNRRIGAAGGILAFAIFANSSYPLQLPSFWILLIFLSVICVAEPCYSIRTRSKYQLNISYVALFAAIASFIIFYLQQDRYQAYKEWNSVKMLYNNKAYEVAFPKYAELYSYLNHKPEFLFEYAQSLSKTNHFTEANILLQRASLLSSDPMIWYMIAKNEQVLGAYKEAERHLGYALNILPERIYPYYLLAKLYAEPQFYDPEKLRSAIDSVLTKEPKVKTTAILEMREEVKKLLLENENN